MMKGQVMQNLGHLFVVMVFLMDVRKLIEEYLICSICLEGFLGIDEAPKHEAKHSTSDIKPKFLREFDGLDISPHWGRLL